MRRAASFIVGFAAAAALAAAYYNGGKAVSPIGLNDALIPAVWWWPAPDGPAKLVPFARPFEGPALRRTLDGHALVVMPAEPGGGSGPSFSKDRQAPLQRFDAASARFDLLSAPLPEDQPSSPYHSAAVSRGDWLDFDPDAGALVEAGPRIAAARHFAEPHPGTVEAAVALED